MWSLKKFKYKIFIQVCGIKINFYILALCFLTLLNLLITSRMFYIRFCQSPTPAARDSTWRDGQCLQWDSLSFFCGLPVYSKFKILFYIFTKILGQRFDIFSPSSPRFIISINHCRHLSLFERAPAAYVSGANFLSWSLIGLPGKPSYSVSFLHRIFLLSSPHTIILDISD